MSHYKMGLEVYVDISEELLTPQLALELVVKGLSLVGCFAVIPLKVEFVSTEEKSAPDVGH